jgi:hypothetical protein
MEDVPGRHYFLEFVARSAALSREVFLADNTTPALLLTSELDAASMDSSRTAASRNDIVGRTASPLPFFIYFVVKRPGANTTPAVTIGRAVTNDIVIPDPGISRIHAALFPQKEGRWTLADASSSGTWVEGERLRARTHRWLGESCQVRLGPAVFAVFMTPERLFELVKRTIPR